MQLAPLTRGRAYAIKSNSGILHPVRNGRNYSIKKLQLHSVPYSRMC